MNKSYIFLIGILIVLAVAVGGFALYRSTTNKSTPLVPVTPQTNNVVRVAPPPPIVTEEQQVSKNNTLPLTITSPQDKAVVTTSTITVAGMTAPGADVSVNDKDVKADASGKFTSQLTLDDGDNYILIVASNENGAAEWQGTVTYTPAQ